MVLFRETGSVVTGRERNQLGEFLWPSGSVNGVDLLPLTEPDSATAAVHTLRTCCSSETSQTKADICCPMDSTSRFIFHKIRFLEIHDHGLITKTGKFQRRYPANDLGRTANQCCYHNLMSNYPKSVWSCAAWAGRVSVPRCHPENTDTCSSPASGRSGGGFHIRLRTGTGTAPSASASADW